MLAWDLSYVFERCRSACEITPIQPARVKGPEYILSVLQNQYPIIEFLAKKYKTLEPARDSIRNWIVILDRKYGENFVLLGPPINLEAKDAKDLAKDCQAWLESVTQCYFDSGTVLIKEENLGQVLPESLTSRLDPVTKADLDDGVAAILTLLPTPAAMILLRVAENVVRRYYTKITGKDGRNVRWSDILDELKKDETANKPLIGYLDYLRDMRNEAQHPDKRFTQEESEQILLHIKNLLEETL